MGNEESLVGFPVKQVVPALVSSHCFILDVRIQLVKSTRPHLNHPYYVRKL